MLICYKSINVYVFIHLYIFSLVLKCAYFTGFFGYTQKFYTILFRYPFDFIHNEHKKGETSTKMYRLLYPGTRLDLIFSNIHYIFSRMQVQHKVCADLLFIVQKSQYLCGFWDALLYLLPEADKYSSFAYAGSLPKPH